MPEALFVVQVPAPQVTPSLDGIYHAGISMSAVYYVEADSHHGWGGIIPTHPYEVAPVGTIRSCLFLTRRALDPKLRVLCCFGYNRAASCIAVLVARLRKVRVVTRSDSNWLHERQRPRWRTRAKRVVLQFIFGRHTRVWTVGSQNDRYWSEFGLINRHLIPFGLPRAPIGTLQQRCEFRSLHLPEAGVVTLYVGVLEPWKGIDILLDAFKAVQNPTARLLVVGKGSLAGLVERAATSDARIVYRGAMPQESLGSAYAAADLLVLPSRHDAWGLVVDEAQANGLRVVVSDMVGCGIDRVHADNGWTFRAGSTESLADVLAAAVEDCERGWSPLPKSDPYDSTAEMIADLLQLGVTTPVVADGELPAGHQ